MQYLGLGCPHVSKQAIVMIVEGKGFTGGFLWSEGGQHEDDSGQIIATSHDLTPKGSFLEGKSPYFRKIQVGEIL